MTPPRRRGKAPRHRRCTRSRRAEPVRTARPPRAATRRTLAASWNRTRDGCGTARRADLGPGDGLTRGELSTRVEAVAALASLARCAPRHPRPGRGRRTQQTVDLTG